MSTDPRIEAAARVRMAEEECSHRINVHPDRCVCEAHGTPFEGMTLGYMYGHYAYMDGLCTYAVEQATAAVAAIDKATIITTFSGAEVNEAGWVCGACEPGDYAKCEDCQSACDDVAQFMNRMIRGTE